MQDAATSTVRVRDQLQHAILEGVLKPGERLRAEALAQRFGTSPHADPRGAAAARGAGAGRGRAQPRRRRAGVRPRRPARPLRGARAARARGRRPRRQRITAGRHRAARGALRRRRRRRAPDRRQRGSSTGSSSRPRGSPRLDRRHARRVRHPARLPQPRSGTTSDQRAESLLCHRRLVNAFRRRDAAARRGRDADAHPRRRRVPGGGHGRTAAERPARDRVRPAARRPVHRHAARRLRRRRDQDRGARRPATRCATGAACATTTTACGGRSSPATSARVDAQPARAARARRSPPSSPPRADIVLENFRPGTMEKWGLGPEDVHARNPRAIYARVSGYGQTGRYAHRPGFASAGEALSGLRYINGYPDQAPPRAGISPRRHARRAVGLPGHPARALRPRARRARARSSTPASSTPASR